MNLIHLQDINKQRYQKYLSKAYTTKDSSWKKAVLKIMRQQIKV